MGDETRVTAREADPLEVTQEMREAFFHAWGEWAYGPRQQGAQREMFAFAAGLAASPAAARIAGMEREVAEYRTAADAEAEEVDRLGHLVRCDREALSALRSILAGEDAEAVGRVASALVRVGGAHDYWPVGLVREKALAVLAAAGETDPTGPGNAGSSPSEEGSDLGPVSEVETPAGPGRSGADDGRGSRVERQGRVETPALEMDRFELVHRVLCRFVFPGCLTPREAMATAVLAALDRGELPAEKTIVPTAALPVLERLRERADDLPGHMASVQRDGRQGPRVFWVDSDDVLALINEAIEEHR